jgi:hypothetical protein
MVDMPYPQGRGHIYGFFGLEADSAEFIKNLPEGNLWYWPYKEHHEYDMR